MPTINFLQTFSTLFLLSSLIWGISSHAITANEGPGIALEVFPVSQMRSEPVNTDKAPKQLSRHLTPPSQNGTAPIAVSQFSEPEINVQSDTLRALIVFTQFSDDKFPGDPNVAFREWPLFGNANQLPPFASHILATSPSPPYPDSSLTEYFYRQSLGQFVLYGEVYDSVIVSSHPEAHYHGRDTGYGTLTKELLDKIDAYGFDFSQYDANDDGLIDHIFVVLRGDSQRDKKTFVWTGASCLDARCSGTIAGGGPESLPQYDGKTVDWNLSGSYILHRTPGNIIPLIYHVRLMAHEIGHDLWQPYFVHIPPNQRNDVPMSHNRRRGVDCISYVLMAGAGGAQDCQGSQTISAFERDLLGWINCTELKETNKDVVLGDLYSTSDCYFYKLGDQRISPQVYLSNLQRVGYFDQLRRGGVNGQFDMGLLRSTGMLAMLRERNRADVIPADNHLQLDVVNEAYDGDLFSPETITQITPWTRPNSNGLNKYPGNHKNHWMAIDNIRYAGDEAGTMLFDYYADFRETPLIREDSWMSSGLSGFQFNAPVTVSNGKTLTIETDVTFGNDLQIGRQSKIIVTATGTLRLPSTTIVQMQAGAKIEVAGTLVLDALVQRSIDTHITKLDEGVVVSGLVTGN